MLKFGVYGIDVLGSLLLRLYVEDEELFTVYNLTVVIGDYITKKGIYISPFTDLEIEKRRVVKVFYDMVDEILAEIRKTRDKFVISFELFKEVENEKIL